MLKTILESFPTLSSPAFIWRQRLGAEKFTSLKKHWLRPDELRPESHFCQKCNSVHRIQRHSNSDIVSVPPNDVHCDKQPLSFEDACLLRFDVRRFAEQLCKQLSIAPDEGADFSRFPCRIGWINGATRQYPVYLFMVGSSRAEQEAKNLLHEDESPFVLLTGADIPQLFAAFKKRKCSLFALPRIANITSANVVTIMTGQEVFSGFLRGAEGSSYTPPAGVQILGDYARIVFPGGYEVRLSSGTVRRSMVRFTHQWVQQSGNPAFDIEVIREAHNKKHPDRQWIGARFKEDLFKRHEADFDRLFEILDNAGGRFRIKF